MSQQGCVKYMVMGENKRSQNYQQTNVESQTLGGEKGKQCCGEEDTIFK